MPWRPGCGWCDRNALGERHSTHMCCAQRLTFRRHGRPHQGCTMPCHTRTVLGCHTLRWVVVTGVTRVSWEWEWYLWLAQQGRQGSVLESILSHPRSDTAVHVHTVGQLAMWSRRVVGASSCCCAVRSQSQAALQTPCAVPPWCHRHCLACATDLLEVFACLWLFAPLISTCCIPTTSESAALLAAVGVGREHCMLARAALLPW